MVKRSYKILLLLITAGILLFTLLRFNFGSNSKGTENSGLNQIVIIEVDAIHDLGEMPNIFTASVWIQKTHFTKIKDAYAGLSPYILDKFLNETKLKWIQTGNAYAIASSKNFSDFKERLRNTILDNPYWIKIRDYANENNITVIFTFHQALMPNWLSSRAGEEWPIYQFAPPKCYKDRCTSWDEITCYTDECRRITEKQFREKGYVEGWESVAKEYARVLKKELGIRNLGISVGHEPDADWLGKEEDFYRLYEYTVRGVKSIDEDILVGGVGSSSWCSKKVSCNVYCSATGRVWNIPYAQVSRACELCVEESGWAIPSNESLTENFIEYCASHNIPLDFINYHVFHTRPEAFFKQVEIIREWLRKNGFTDTRIYPADWTIWGGSYPLADYIDNERNPAYVIRALYFMEKAGIDWHGHDFDVNDGGNKERKGLKERGDDAQFIGDWAIFTRDGVIKPVWNAFKALSKLPDRRIQAISSDEDHIIAIAGRDDQKISVLISNYIWEIDKVTVGIFFKECMLTKYTEEEWKLIINSLKETIEEYPPEKDPDKDGSKEINENYLKWIIVYTDFPELLNNRKVRGDLTSCALQVKEKINQEKYLMKHPRNVTLIVKNIPSGAYVLRIYIIDKDHSNSCRYNKRTEPKPTGTECGINGTIDERVKRIKEKAKLQATAIVREYLSSKCYSDRDIEMLFRAWKEYREKSISFKDLVKKRYTELDRCNASHRGSCHPCNFETIWKEITEAYSIYENAYFNLLYYGKYTTDNGRTIELDDWIDKINKDSHVSLEGSAKEKTVVVRESRELTLNLTIQPYSVILIELEKRDNAYHITLPRRSDHTLSIPSGAFEAMFLASSNVLYTLPYTIVFSRELAKCWKRRK